MKHFFLLILFLPLFSFSQGKKIKNDLTKFNYKGQIKSIVAYTYKAVDKSGVIVKDSLISKSLNSFNISGFIVEQSMYKQGNKLTTKRSCKYDIHNNIVEEKRVELITLRSSKDSLMSNLFQYTYTYNPQGNWIDCKSSENREPWDKTVRTLDKNGNVLVERTYAANIFEGKRTFQYDSTGNMTEESYYRNDSSLMYRYDYQYDKLGNNTELMVYRKDGTLDWKENIVYDGQGNKVEDINNTKGYKLNWDYRFEPSKFDDKGNWTSEVCYDKGEPKTIVERTIEYY